MRRSTYNAACAVTAVFLLALAGCDLMTKSETGQSPAQDGKAAVSLAIAGTGARTVAPANATLGDVKAWKLLGTKTGDDPELLREFTDPTEVTLYLETGDWAFTLEGHKEGSDNTLILEGTLTQTISLEEPNTLSFMVEPVSEGTGTVTITITLPVGHGLTQVKVFKDGLDLNSPIEPSGDSVVFEKTGHEAGDFYYSFRLCKGDDLYGVVSEVVKVRRNLTSAKIYNLGLKELNLSYLITFNLNGGAFAEDPPASYRSTDADLTLPEPTRDYYHFGGWYDNEDLEEDPVTKIDQGSMEKKDFWAKWTPIPYTINYELYGGENDDTNPKSYNITSPAITLKDPTHATREFQGWYTGPGFNEGDKVTGIPTGSNGTKTFYARWKPRANVGITLLTVSPDPALEGKKVPKGTQEVFTIDAGYTGCQWYWDGVSIGGATGSSYTLLGTETAGIHELSVVVTNSSGEGLSARCQVTIQAK